MVLHSYLQNHTFLSESTASHWLAVRFSRKMQTKRHMKGGSIMTSNQIALYKAMEEARHNRMMEAETNRANLVRERNDRSSINEQIRSNRAQESLKGQQIGVDYAKLAETSRSNRANEAIGRSQASSSMTQASASLMRARSGSELDYANAGLRYSETALTDLKASNVAADTALKQYQAYQTITNIGVLRAQRDNILTQTEYIPLQAWGQAVGNVGKAAGSLTN